MHRHSLRRAVPAAVTVLGLAALAVPAAYAKGGAGGEIVYNTESVTLSGFAGGTKAVSVSRDGVAIANGTVAVDAATGVGNLNVTGLVLPELPTQCWTGFTPDILPGDIVTIDGTPTTMPDFTVSRPAQAGGDLVTNGTATDAAGNPIIAGLTASLVSKLTRFPSGTKGGAQFDGVVSPVGASWSARFFGMTPGDLAIGLGPAASRISMIAPAVDVGAAVVPPAFTVSADNPAVHGPVAECAGSPAGSDAVTGSSVTTVNQANEANALTITGTAQPGTSAVSITVGGSVFPAALAGGTWSATVPASGLPEGTLPVAGRYSVGGGVIHGRTMSITKDTIAPNAPNASINGGTYSDTQNVALSTSDGTIHYTTNGSDPRASSPTYTKAIPVADSKTIKAIAIDAAGNVSDVASFGYTIARPAPAPAPAPVVAPIKTPKLKLDALTISSSYKLKTARKRGVSMVVFAPEGAKVVRVRIMRGSRIIDQVIRKVTKDGVITVVLPHSKRARRALRRGTYKVLVTPGTSASKLGATTTRTVRIR